MAKRGKYMQYNNRHHVSYDSASVVNRNIREGREIVSKFEAERQKHFIGEKMVLNRRIDKDSGNIGPTIEGRVIGIYPHFLLVHCGNYKSTVSYIDLILGGKIYA